VKAIYDLGLDGVDALVKASFFEDQACPKQDDLRLLECLTLVYLSFDSSFFSLQASCLFSEV